MLFRLLLSAFLIVSVLLPVPSLALRFTEHVITDELENVQSICSIDIDQDNDMDVIAGSLYCDVVGAPLSGGKTGGKTVSLNMRS